MFEGKLPERGNGRLAKGEGEPLRELTWSDLVARLSAARDLRRELAAPGADHDEDLPPASFDADSARRISAQETGKHVINQTASAYRKTNQAVRAQEQFRAREK